MTNIERGGERYILAEAFLWGFFPIVSSILLKSFSPFLSLGISMLFAAMFFAIVLTIQKKWNQLNIKFLWKDLSLISIGFGFYYVFLFIGLQFTSPGNASIVGLMEIFFTMFLLGTITKKEKLGLSTISGGILMIIGVFLVIFQGSFNPNKGDMIILLANIIPPFLNYITKKVRITTTPLIILFARNTSVGIFLVSLSYVLGESIATGINIKIITLFIINGIILFGLSKIFWIEAMHRMSISKTISLGSMCSVFTLFFMYFIFKVPPTIFQLLGLIPIITGVYLLTHIKSSLKNPA